MTYILCNLLYVYTFHSFIKKMVLGLTSWIFYLITSLIMWLELALARLAETFQKYNHNHYKTRRRITRVKTIFKIHNNFSIHSARYRIYILVPRIDREGYRIGRLEPEPKPVHYKETYTYLITFPLSRLNG